MADNQISLQAILDDDQVQAEIDKLITKIKILQENLEAFAARRGEWSIQRQISNLTREVEALRGQLTGAAADFNKLNLAAQIERQFGISRVVPAGTRAGGFQTATTVGHRALEDSIARDARVDAELELKRQAALQRALSQVQRIVPPTLPPMVEPTLPPMVEPRLPSMVGFLPTEAELAQQKLKGLVDRAKELQASIRAAGDAKIEGGWVDALKKNLTDVNAQIRQLGGRPPLPPITRAEAEYDLQRETEKFSLISNLRDQEWKSAQRSADQREAQAQKDHQFDLQRRLDVASEIDNQKKLAQARAEAEQEKAARAGYTEADKEISVQRSQQRADREYDLQRRADIAQQLQIWRSLSEEQRAAARASGQLAPNLRNAGNAASIISQEAKHFVAIIDSLSAGRIGQVFASIGAAIRDAGVGVQSLLFGLGALIAIQVGRRIISDLSEWSRQLSELALKQQGLATITGMSGKEFAQFSDSMRLAGGNAETATRAIESLHRRMEEAVETPTSPLADSFRAVGLEFDDLQQRLRDPQGSTKTLRDLADTYVRMGNVPQRNAIFESLLGGTRQLAELLRYLDRGSAGIDQMTGRSKELGEGYQNNTEKLAKMGEHIEELGIAWDSFRAEVVSSDLFANATQGLTHFLVMLQHGVRDLKQAKPIESSSITSGAMTGAAAAAAAIPPLAPLLAPAGAMVGAVAAGLKPPPPEVVATAEIPPDFSRAREETHRTAPGQIQTTIQPGFTEAATRAYIARIQQERVEAQLVHNETRLAELAQQESEFTKATVRDREKILQQAFPGITDKATLDQLAQQSKAQEIIDRQQRDQAEFTQQTQIAQLKLGEAIAESEGDLARVVELRKQEAGIVAQSQYATPAQKIEALAQVVRESTQEQRRAFQERENLTRLQERLDSLRISGQRALMQAQVASHNMSRAQAAEAEAQLTASVMAGEESRTAAMLQADGLTRQQKEQLYAHLAELYEKDADAQLKAQEAVTKAIEEENKKRAQIFEQTFSRIGSTIESSIGELLVGKTTFAKAATNIRTSIIESLTKGALDLGSQLIGKSIAPSLGVKTEGLKDTSISTVLGQAVSKLFGLQKDVPQDHLKLAAEKMNQASQAQQRAVDLQSQAARTMHGSGTLLDSAGKALLEAAKELKAYAEGIRSKAGVPALSGATVGGSAQSSEAVSVPTAANAPEEYKTLIQSSAEQYSVPTELLSRTLQAESSFNPQAKGPVTRFGWRAMGIAQFSPDTAKQYGVTDPLDPSQAIPGAAHYLSDLRVRSGSWMEALRGYLGGDPNRDPSYLRAGVPQLARKLDLKGEQLPTKLDKVPEAAPAEEEFETPEPPPAVEVPETPKKTSMLERFFGAINPIGTAQAEELTPYEKAVERQQRLKSQLERAQGASGTDVGLPAEVTPIGRPDQLVVMQRELEQKLAAPAERQDWDEIRRLEKSIADIQNFRATSRPTPSIRLPEGQLPESSGNVVPFRAPVPELGRGGGGLIGTPFGSRLPTEPPRPGEDELSFRKILDYLNPIGSARAAESTNQVPVIGGRIPVDIQAIRGSTVASTTAGTIPVKFDQTVGDSIAVGFNKFGGIPGTSIGRVSTPGAAAFSAAGGRNPQQVLDYITANQEFLRGQNVLLSSGLMNAGGPEKAEQSMDLVQQQIEALKSVNSNLVLAGVDRGRFAQINPQLAALATKENVPFAGPLPTSDIHPGPEGYRQYAASATSMLKVDPANVAQGVQQGEGQVAHSTDQNSQETQRNTQATTSLTQAIDRNTQKSSSTSTSNQGSVASSTTQTTPLKVDSTDVAQGVEQGNQQLGQTITSGFRQGAVGFASGTNATAPAFDTTTQQQQTQGGLFSSLSSLGQAAALASSAMNLFGLRTSRTVQIITGGLGLLSSLGSLFGSSSSSGSSSVSSFGSLFSGIGGIFSIFKGIGSLFFDSGGIFPSAAQGTLVGEHGAISLPKMLSNSGPNLDGRGGRLIVAHPGEMIVPAAHTSELIRKGIIQSAAGGMIVDGRGSLNLGSNVNETISNLMNSMSNDNSTTVNEGDTHISISALDHRSVAQLIASQPEAVAQAFARGRRSFNSKAR